eukprot:8059944-Pyramimonas_sp.AAC.1
MGQHAVHAVEFAFRTRAELTRLESRLPRRQAERFVVFCPISLNPPAADAAPRRASKMWRVNGGSMAGQRRVNG